MLTPLMITMSSVRRHDPGKAPEAPPTAAGRFIIGGQVPGAVAQQRHALPGEVGEDQFARLPRRQGLKGPGVQHFQQEGVFPDVHAVLFRALKRHRAVHFGQPIGVIGLDPVSCLDAPPHIFGVRLCRRRPGAAAESRGSRPLWAKVCEQVQGIARDDVDRGGAELLHQLQLALAVAGPTGMVRAPNRSAP